MKDNFINHNFDKLLLFILVVCFAFMIDHILDHHAGDMQSLAIVSGAFSTVLGALVMILTGRSNRADGQTANGQPPNSTFSQVTETQSPIPNQEQAKLP